MPIEVQPAVPSQELDGGSQGEHFVSGNRRKCQRCHMDTLGQTQPASPPWYRALAPRSLESICSAPWGALTPKNPLFSSTSHSPATGLQIAHGDISNIHPGAKSNKGGIKRTCTIQEVSTAARREQCINIDCSPEDLEIFRSPN